MTRYIGSTMGLSAEIAGAGFEPPECVYRFRDRVTLRAPALSHRLSAVA